MRIAVVDVAAESGGARTILEDFCCSLEKNEFKEHSWVIMTSVVNIKDTDNVKSLSYPFIKKNWLFRLVWEYILFRLWIAENEVDFIISLQNKALPIKKIPQIVYFHNLFLVMDNIELPNWRSIIYSYFIKPITLHSLKKSKCVIVQTRFMKKKLLKYNPNLNIKIMYPNVKCIPFNEVKDCYGKAYKGWIYPATADEYKQHELIVSAIKYLKEEMKKNIEFDIIFTFKGTENKYAKKIYNMSKNIERIKFVGKLDREQILISYLYYGLVITSRYESYPMPISEAMYYNAPISCFNYDYATEITASYKRTFLCEKENYKELANNLALITKLNNEGFINNNLDYTWNNILDLLK